MFMKKYHTLLAVFAFFFTQHIFANTPVTNTSSNEESSQCEMIAKACLNAGYIRDGATGKAFWPDCMKPILLGQTVNGVSISPTDAQTCRQSKIEQLKQLLQKSSV